MLTSSGPSANPFQQVRVRTSKPILYTHSCSLIEMFVLNQSIAFVRIGFVVVANVQLNGFVACVNGFSETLGWFQNRAFDRSDREARQPASAHGVGRRLPRQSAN